MDEDVLRAMLKWPNVPALFGWLQLDRRGNWHIQDQRVDRDALVAFIGRNYAHDEQGRWYFQNGPQRGYVALEYTPWVLRAQLDGTLQTHTGLEVRQVAAGFIDENGSLLLSFDDNVGLLTDTDLDWAIARFQRCDGRPVDDVGIGEALEQLQSGTPADLALHYQGKPVPLTYLHSDEVPVRFGFVREPTPGEGGEAAGAQRT
ncbi:MAG TPA: DUF2946 family protein [Gammaproteobacteria bacterium]|nr:DUF2946 family protein [Gammaproteobacteria bacterium]